MGKPNAQPPTLNEDKTETLTGTANSKVTQNPNTQTPKAAIEEPKTTAATNQVAGVSTIASTPKVADETTTKSNENAEVPVTPAEPVPETAEGVNMQ